MMSHVIDRYLINLNRIGKIVAIWGVILPLLLIGIAKFTPEEAAGLAPIFSAAPWLGWLETLFGLTGASYFLGVVEIITAFLLMVSPWSAKAAVLGGAMGVLTFMSTLSLVTVMPFWDPKYGFGWISSFGQFVIKDVALLGVSIVIFADGLRRYRENLTDHRQS